MKWIKTDISITQSSSTNWFLSQPAFTCSKLACLNMQFPAGIWWQQWIQNICQMTASRFTSKTRQLTRSGWWTLLMLLSNTQTYYQLQCWFYRLHPPENLPKVNPEKNPINPSTSPVNPINKSVFQFINGHLDMILLLQENK